MKQSSRQWKDQSGMALILAIGFLAILSIIGAVVMKTATLEIKNSGSFLPSQQAFYTADRAVEYALNRDIILNLSPSGTPMDLVTENMQLVTPSAPDQPHAAAINDPNGNGTLTTALIRDLGPRDMPANVSGLFGDEFSANLYHVEVKATGPVNTTSNVDASIVRLFKRDDDTIFRTTKGG